ncbi:hypothetical protein [Tritonibacter mobilis]|uniref:hypothetical protein n=1 Tax=Tritonibacter mobilis TaxID=379347 RepID=UPI0039A505AC
MGKLLKLIFVTLSLLALAKEPAMADNMDHGYYAKIVSEGSAWSLRVNDLHLRDNVEVGFGNSTGNIGRAVQPGRNTVSILFAPITGKNPETGEYEQSLRDGVSFEVTIERLDFKTRESLEVNALHIVFDEEKNRFVNWPQTRFGQDRVMRFPLLWSEGKFEFSEQQTEKLILANGQTFDAYRLDLEFYVDDKQLWPHHWESQAVPLEDTPEMRQELWSAYQELHALFQSGDTEEFFRRMEQSWARAAHIYTMNLKSGREFIEDTRMGLATYQPVRPDGKTLQPLFLASDLQNAAVQLYANDRLAWIRPGPIYWEDPDTGEREWVSVVFFKTPTGEWKIAEINIGL